MPGELKPRDRARPPRSENRHAAGLPRRATRGFVWAGLAAFGLCNGRLPAGITESQVLVVYNSNTGSTEGTDLKNYYLAAHPGIPAANVLDLNNSQLNVPDISYSQFVALVRDPIRSHLLPAGPPDPSGIVAICLVRPFPHRILDTTVNFAGDYPGGNPPQPNTAIYEVINGDATYASVDAELCLLWQNLDAGEAGGAMDSPSDNFIDNPYHQSASPIGSFTRANIQVQKLFAQDPVEGGGLSWVLAGAGSTQLTPGDMVLVCRIDGNTPADARAEIDRIRNLYVNKALVKLVLDEFDTSACTEFDNDGLYFNDATDAFWAGDDYERTRDALSPAAWNVRYDAAFDFIEPSEETGAIMGYASYGENNSLGGCGQDPPNHGVFIAGFRFPPGAVFNTIESFNGRQFNNLAPHPVIVQEQISHFIEVGGTFGVGSVWEPFSFSVPDNAFLIPNMLLNGLTFAEAAYTSFPALSWQQIAVGDPLGRMTILNDPALPKGDMDGSGVVNGRDIDWFVDVVTGGIAGYRVTFPALDPVGRGDFDGDFKVTTTDLPGFVSALLTAP